MKKLNKIISLLIVILIVNINQDAKAQGCSDAGFCTINSFKPASPDSLNKQQSNQIKIGFSTGKADHSISIFNSYLEYNRQFTEKIAVDAKLAFMSQSGNGISASGISDFYLTANYAINKSTTFTIGTKIPFSNGNKTNAGIALPMDYQPSLGTVDLIAGFGYEIKKIKLVVALQQPVTQNSNQFLADGFPAGSFYKQFQSTNQYKRSGDILFRASYPLQLTNKITLTPSLLPIYHLANDAFTDINGTKQIISGSQGFTINSNLYLDFSINQSNAISLNVGAPFVTRKSRPDGLTRSFVATLEYRIKF